jgi:hypothetical protein
MTRPAPIGPADLRRELAVGNRDVYLDCRASCRDIFYGVYSGRAPSFMNRRVSVCSQLGDQAFFARDLSDIEMEYTFVDAALESLRRRRALVC